MKISYDYDEEDHEYNVAVNGVVVGWLYCEVDGYYVFDMNPTLRGYTPGWLLRSLADKLDELNAEWDAKIRDDPSIGAPVSDVQLELDFGEKNV